VFVTELKYLFTENFTVALEALLLGQLFILRTIFQHWALSSYKPSAERGLFTKYIYLFLGEEWRSRYKWFQGNRSVSTSYDETEKYETRLGATSLHFVLLQQNLEQSKTKIRLPQFAPT